VREGRGFCFCFLKRKGAVTFGGSVAATVRTNTAIKLKNGTYTLFIFATMVYLNHSLVLLILDGWNTVRVLHL